MSPIIGNCLERNRKSKLAHLSDRISKSIPALFSGRLLLISAAL